MIREIEFYSLFLPSLWAFLIAIFAIPSITYLAHVKNLLDIPNNRAAHISLTPRLGGLAIFAGFMSSITIFINFSVEESKGVQQILASCILLFFIGLKDDIAPVSAFKKFFVQVLASGIVMFMADIRIESLYGILGIYDLDIGISYAITFIAIIGITNAINLIDGIDGLAGSIVVLSCMIFGYFFFLIGSTYALLAFSLLGAVLGFLRYNFFKASIFMGDTGSLVCGFIVAIMAIKFISIEEIQGAPIISLAVLIVPIVDTLRVFIIRSLAGKSPFTPDKNHIHHILTNLGLSSVKVVLTLCSINLFIVLLVISTSHLNVNILFAGLLILSLLFIFLLKLVSIPKK